LKAVGLKGELRIKPLTDNPDRYAVGGSIWLTPPGGEPRAFVIRSIKEYKGSLTVGLDGIETVGEAEGYRGQEVFVPESMVPPLPEGEYYHFQVLGLPVYTHKGILLGKVEDIFTAGEKDVYVVRGKGREYLIPVTEETVREIDVKEGRIDLHPMKGYIPEDEV
jgi:16S rRNA processing protein RimM